MIASMFEENAKLPKTMGLVSTLLYFPKTNFIHLHCSYQKLKATACCCLRCQISNGIDRIFNDIMQMTT